MPQTWIVSLDVGSSSVRSLLFDGTGRHIEGYGEQLPYAVTTTADGGIEIDADKLASLAVQTLTVIHRQVETAGIKPAAVAFCTFWHNVLGVDASGRPTTTVLHPLDTRSAGAAVELAKRIDNRAQHSRTGCVLHPSYLPAKLLWLSKSCPDVFGASRRWMSFGEYFFLKLSGTPVNSSSMASGTGLWNQNANDYDEEILNILPVKRSQLSQAETLDSPMTGLLPEYRSRWPLFSGIPWFPALGDGACNNIGSGCITPARAALMVGTTGAMRVVSETECVEIPEGLWCYRVDRRRYVLGGALSNGGDVYAWMKRTLRLPPEEEMEAQLAAMAPGAHGLTVMPLFAGERSTKWRGDARAAIAGMSMHTGPLEIVRAALEAVALRFRNIYEILSERFGPPQEVIASGGALLRSPAWTQMMADALGRPIVACLEPEASSRGAVLLALERLGAISHIRDLPASMGSLVLPIEKHHRIYDDQIRRQRRFYTKLFEE